MFIVHYTTRAGNTGARIFVNFNEAVEYEDIRSSKGHNASVLEVDAKKFLEWLFDNDLIK